MPDQPSFPSGNAPPEDNVTRTHHTPTSGEADHSLGEAPPMTVTGGTPVSVGDLVTRTGTPASARPPGASGGLGLVREIGRYRVERVLGEGGFGVVYLAHDDQLKRRVAIKVPQPRVIRCPEDADQYLVEAQIVAKLEHPFIVPVYDVGRTAEGLPFIVSRFVEGCNLAERMRQSRLSTPESVRLVIRMAEALSYAHDCKLVHRDVKPGNILMEDGSRPFLVDFGLALREEDIGKGSSGGTPAYMSPEQANGEGHLVDGRSDIYSLGVILYELLTGERPHTAQTIRELLKLISETDPRAPRQLDETIPPELERITLKALAKRASDRYSTAKELAEDLRHWLTPKANATKKESATAKIVPKGLRSFDAGDTDFFLELLPGPRDRDGLPESLRFWKTRIEESDPAKTFRVGVIYGPSGCGKSSFVKAGLLPRLADRVRVVYIEATPDETESRLLRGLERACPDMTKGGSLRDAIIYLRRREDANRKVVLIIDQFEQWLHSGNRGELAGLVHDLRHCDGEHVQCIVMTRADFWMPLNRFMDKMEVKIVGGQNSAAIDLFDTTHAHKVLWEFGRAYGVLPAEGMPSPEQEAFLTLAVDGMAEEEKVISVRIALFAEMMKVRVWTPATLDQVGGTEGIGVTFLEETFSSRTAPPEHRHHQDAARGVLRALLPGSGTDIKGHMRSLSNLQGAAGYSERPKEFDDLLAILDGELRLITPTDAGGVESAPSGERYYQLTHDFLVPSLRDWLTRKQKETPQGRAELLLEDRAGVWNACPEIRQLPSLFQWVRIRRLIPKKLWNAAQAKMMAKAGRYHGLRVSTFALFVALTGVTGWTLRGQARATSLVETLLSSETSRAPDVIRDMADYRRWALPLLRAKAETSADGSPERLRCGLAMLESKPDEADYLYVEMLRAGPGELVVIRDALASRQGEITERLWGVLENPQGDAGEKLRAAAALSKYSPSDQRWGPVAGNVAATLASQKVFVQMAWAESLHGASRWLLPPLAEFITDENRSIGSRSLISNLYGLFAHGQKDSHAMLEKILSDSCEPRASFESQFAAQKKQASAAISLLIMGREAAWPTLHHSSDPTVRTLIIDRIAPSNVDIKLLQKKLYTEPEPSIRRALIQALAEYGLDQLPLADRMEMVPRISKLYREDPDSGIHSSTGYLMKRWGLAKELRPMDQELRSKKTAPQRNWYVNSQGQTMSLIINPGSFWMGEGESLHRRRIGRNYAIATTEVTVEQFERFIKERPIDGFEYEPGDSPSKENPINSVTWYDAVAYCNWLSEKDGIPKEHWCYVPNNEGKYAAGMSMKTDFMKLEGYRLPTEAEWEFACRAGSETAFAFGESSDLLRNYGWHDITTKSNKTYPVGSLRPNDYGLFDMHGNLWEWCQDTDARFRVSWKGVPTPDHQDDKKIVEQKNDGRIRRGGSFLNVASAARSSNCSFGIAPTLRFNYDGFRPAKSINSEKAAME